MPWLLWSCSQFKLFHSKPVRMPLEKHAWWHQSTKPVLLYLYITAQSVRSALWFTLWLPQMQNGSTATIALSGTSLQFFLLLSAPSYNEMWLLRRKTKPSSEKRIRFLEFQPNKTTSHLTVPTINCIYVQWSFNLYLQHLTEKTFKLFFFYFLGKMESKNLTKEQAQNRTRL